MTNIPPTVLATLNALFGARAKPHRASFHEVYGEKPLRTGNWYWKITGNYDRARSVQAVDEQLELARVAVAGEPVLVYKHIVSVLSIRATVSDGIVVCPGTDQFDILRHDWGANVGVSTDVEYWVEKLAGLDREYGLTLTGAGHQSIEFVVRQNPDPASAKSLIYKLHKLSKDVLQNVIQAEWMARRRFDPETEDPMRLLDEFEMGEGRIALWFD